MKRITIDGQEFNLVPVEAEILPNYHTMDEIYNSVKPKAWIDNVGNCFVGKTHDSKTNLPTKEDAEHIAASIQLINIATFYNAIFPSECKNSYFGLSYSNTIHIYNIGRNFCGLTLFTPSAAKAALENPNVVEVLQKYFRIK